MFYNLSPFPVISWTSFPGFEASATLAPRREAGTRNLTLKPGTVQSGAGGMSPGLG